METPDSSREKRLRRIADAFKRLADANVATAIAAMLTALTGVYVALAPERSSPPPAPAVYPESPPNGVVVQPAAARLPAKPDQLDGASLRRTPWLGIEIRQDGNSVMLQSRGEDWSKIEANIESGPIELVLPEDDERSIGVVAWNQANVFDEVTNGSYQLGGTGVAGAEFAMPVLYLTLDGFNYFDRKRMRPIDRSMQSIDISKVGSGELEIPLSQLNGPLYLVVFRVPTDHSLLVPQGDYEFITLNRP